MASYLHSVIELLAQIAQRANAKSAEAESYVSRLEGTTRLESNQRRKAISVFTKSLDAPFELEQKAEQFLKNFAKKPHTITACLDSLIRVFSSNSEIFFKVEDEIKNVARIFQFPNREYRKLRAWNLGVPFIEEELQQDQPSKHLLLYQQLGCEDRASLEQVRKSYRQLALLYHPDRQSALDFPPEVLLDLNRRFQEIQSAYEQLRKLLLPS